LLLIYSNYVQSRQKDSAVNAQNLNGLAGSYYLNYNNFTNTPNILDSANVSDIVTSFNYTTYDSTNTIEILNDYATQSYVDSQIQTIIGGAPETLNTLNEIAAALNDDDSAFQTLNTLINAKTNYDSANAAGQIEEYGYTTYDSANTIQLVDSAYIQVRQSDSVSYASNAGLLDGYNRAYYINYNNFTNTPNILDSADIVSLIDSAYVQARQDDIFRDSASIEGIVDSAYIQARQTPQDFAYSSLTGTPTVLDSNNIFGIIDSAYIEARTVAGTDSAAIINLIDSDYINARVSGSDSASIISIVDSAYVAVRAGTYGRVGVVENTIIADSGQTVFPVGYVPSAVQVYINGILLSNGLDYTAANGSSVILTSPADSGDALVVMALGGDSSRIENVVNIIVDSAYIQARQTPGTDGTDSAAVLALVTSDGFTKYDSADTLGLIDSAYIRQRVSTDQNLNTADSVEFAKITVAGLSYPIADGTSGQMITTDGSGLLTFDDPAVEAVFVLVKNVSGGPLAKGTPLHQTGTIGSGTIEVVAARADTVSLMPAVSILNDSLNDEEEGRAIISGKISGVNTSAFSEGDVIFVAETGGFTNVKPAGESNIIQNLGIVTRVDASNGGGVVLGAGRGAATPNLDAGKIFIGNDSDYSSTITLNTTIVPEGTNLYYTTARHDSDAGVYLTNNSYATQTYVTTAIDNLIDGAPGTLNTLNEIAAALNDDDSAYATLVTLIGTKTDFDSADATALITSYGYSTYDSTNTLGLIDSAYIQARETAQDFAYSSLTGAPTTLSSFTNDTNYLDSTTVTGVIDASYIQANQTTYDFLDSAEAIALIATQGYLTDAIDSARITSMLAADSFSIGGTIIGDGKIEIRNGTGSTPSYVDLYCEVSNAHYTRIQSEAHANYSGNVTLTTPTTSGTLALTSDVVDSAAIIALIQANDQQRDSAFVTGIIDSAYINQRVDAVSGTDSATVIALITSTVDSAYVALREANAGVVGGGLDSAAIINLIDSAYVTARETNPGITGGGSGIDSDNVIGLIDSAYVQARTNSISYNSVTTYNYLADSGQTTFSGNDQNGNSLSYFSDQLQVFVNGILLLDSADYIATSGVSIVLNTPSEINDNITISTFRGGTNATIETNITSYEFIADSGQTTFSGTDRDGNALSYTAGSALVFLNGTILVDSNDYIATNGTSITLTEGTDSGDFLSIVKVTSTGLVTVDGLIDSVHVANVLNQQGFTSYDSSNTIGLIDSAYIALRIPPSSAFDSDNALGLIDSAYIALRIPPSSTFDSDNALGLIDSAYVQARQTADKYSEVTSSITAEINKKYIIDTTTAVTLTLPSSASLGDEIKIIDGTGNAGTNNITISRNGNKILGADSDFTIDVNRTSIDLVYYNTTQGWIISGTS